MDNSTRLKIVELRNEGYSYKKIGEYLSIGASTVSDFWLGVGKSNELWWEGNRGLVPPDMCPGGASNPDIEALCEASDTDVANLAKRLRTAQRANTQLRRALNGASDVTSHIPDMIEAVTKATTKLSTDMYYQPTPKVVDGCDSVTYEVLLSDYQIGKIGQHYDSSKAELAMKRYGQQIVQKIVGDSYNVDKIVLALLGDLVEDHLKHGVQSATSTDSGLAEQMARAIEHLWKYIVKPLGEFGHEMEVVCIAGNHGSSQHKGMDMYKAGLYSYDYVIYKALEGYCAVAGMDHVKFIIPEGCFGYTEIYGRSAVYEHGYFNSSTEKSLEDQRNKRANQLKRHVEYFRCGDMHHVCNYDNGKLVVNGAFFGVDTAGEEYSGIMGYSSIPAQVMFTHKNERSLGRNTVQGTYVVQVADGY